MDTGSPARVSVSEDVNGSDDVKQLYPESSLCTCHVLEDVALTELGNGLTEFLHIEDDQKLEPKSILCQPSNETDSHNVEKEDDCNVRDQTESTIIASEKCLLKCLTFPCSGKEASLAVSKDVKDDITAAESSACHRSISLPSPLKLVSAMKGSREKQGTPPKKLTVTWAPDVYDPPPSSSSTSTSVRVKQPRTKSGSKKNYDWKKNGKNKQKGKPTKGGSSKDKKQFRKHGGSSSKCFQSLDVDGRVVDCNEPCGELRDFDAGSPDSYCGSSFLKKSVTKLHFSVAEAT